jgi:hypothetical protein
MDIDEKLYNAMKNYCLSLHDFLNGNSSGNETLQKIMWYDLIAITLYINKDELVDYESVDKAITRLAKGEY